MKNSRSHILLLLSACLLTSCHISRYIPDGAHVLHRADLDVSMADSSNVTPLVRDALNHATNYYAQRPNTKVLGIQWLPVGKWIYCISRPTDNTIWGRYWRRLGQEPVIYDEQRSRYTARQLQLLLESKGCFGSQVTFDTTRLSKHNIEIAYRVSATQRYVIDEIHYRTQDATVRQLLNQWADDSPLQVGKPYDQENIAAERTRLVNNLRDAGYYRANPQLVTFRVDTTYDHHRLSIDVLLDSRDLQVYHINNIFVYPNLNTGQTSFDTLIYSYPSAHRRIDYQFIYSSQMPLKPQTISRAIMLFPGMIYRPRYISNSYNSLLSLRTFKYINTELIESPSSSDSLRLLDAHVRLMPAIQQRLSLSLELTNASPLSSDSNSNFFLLGNLGFETALEYQHKNLFGGAEVLRVKGSVLLEFPKLSLSGENSDLHNFFSTFEQNIEASLDMPVFLLPGSQRFTRTGMRPHTLVSVGFHYQYRPYYERGIFSTSFGYTWSQMRGTAHQLLPLEITFVSMMDIDNAFASRLAAINDLRIKYQYSSHFIVDARYDYTYSTQQYGTRNNFTTMHLTAESAGNLLSAATSLGFVARDSSGIGQMLGVPFAQYIRLGGELTRYIYLGNRSSLVARLIVGIGLPYSNSTSMPYEKSFYGGGPTTLRAWQLRHLGPGNYSGSVDMFERVGDLQLVANIEGRFPLVSIFEGALFADMGNVWLTHASTQYPGGEFKARSIPSEVAVGIGFGLRAHVSIATLRLDLALPLYDPGFSSDLRWRPRHWNASQLVANFGINYPF